MSDRVPWLVSGLLAVLAVLAVIGWALFHEVREVRASTTIRCGDTVLEVRRIYEQTGHTPLSYGQEIVRIGPPGTSPPATRTNRAPIDGLAPEGLPARTESGTVGDGSAWAVFAPEPDRYACLSQNLDALRTALGSGPDGSTGVVVWAGTADDVWPAFSDPDGTVLRVRRDGRIEVERSADGALSSELIGGLMRLSSGVRVRVLTGEALPIVARATDARGRTLDARFPATLLPPEPWEAIVSRLPVVPLETPTR